MWGKIKSAVIAKKIMLAMCVGLELKMRTETKQKIKKELKDEPLSRISKQIRREVRTKKKLKKKLPKKVVSVDSQKEIQEYIGLINEKLSLLLGAITEDKVKGSNLASISKAFRSILGQRDALAENEKKEPDKSMSINFNINDMSKEDMIALLTAKSQNQD